jgi:pyruvate dehydrogenase E2 component (dihydrolipoamide acetyltransferase)
VKADVESADGKPAAAAARRRAETRGRPRPPPAMPAGRPRQVRRCTRAARYTEVPLDGMRKTVAARLTEAKQTIPHFYLRRDIKLDALLKFRSQLNKQLEARGVKLSVNDFIIKACANALQAVPDANAVWAGDRMLKLTPSDVAVAVAVEGGLFTPVLKDAHHEIALGAFGGDEGPRHPRPRPQARAP